MTYTGLLNNSAVAKGEYGGVGRYSFGVPVEGRREHPLESSTTVGLPSVPVTVLNETILVTESGPSSGTRLDRASL